MLEKKTRQRSSGSKKVQPKKQTTVMRVSKSKIKAVTNVEDEFKKFWPHMMDSVSETQDESTRLVLMMRIMTNGMLFQGPSHVMKRNGNLYPIC
jgi:hypothetical protein